MDAELKRKWIADLRSGKFRQTDNMLHRTTPDAHCCLGVLCITAGATFLDEWTNSEGAYYYGVPVLDDENIAHGEDQELSGDFMNRIGLPRTEQGKLISMNDEGVPFEEIADYIEKNL